MKKIFLIAAMSLLGAYSVYAQQNTPGKTEQAKAGLKNTLAHADYTRIFLKKIPVTDAQKPQVNKIIADYLDAKRTLGLATRNNPAAYQQQQPALFNTFKTNLSAVLSTAQMNTFLASKPAPDDDKNFLNALFY
ncbi:hypothetical protein ACTJJ0_29875 [Chitinophaga sp. 22321]|uniref:Uncharacterized protein n=1 Tax=Chitinophaga hostae TaxID=2831022 RepID=A0ABS5J7L3_9BACT|nr:hypothetical protein [Chitinophaga hostae]MBS0031208.1 hypothetical protein [Chitinophaga hostae]